MRLARAALLIGLGNLLSRFLGIARDSLIAALVGGGVRGDAFRIAFRIPLIFYDQLVGGMITAAFVPVFADYRAREDPELGRVASSVINLAALVLGATALLLSLAAPVVVNLIAAGADPDTRALAVDLARITPLAVLFLGLAGVNAGLLYARQSYGWASLGIIASNAGLLVAALVLWPAFGISGLAMAVVAGGLSQFLVQLPGWKGLRYELTIAWRHPGLGRVLHLYWPVAALFLISTIQVLLDLSLASTIGEGRVAAVGYAQNVMQLPVGLIAAALNYAVLPRLAGQAALAEETEYRRTLSQGIIWVIVLSLPVVTGIAVLGGPLVRLIYQRGAFDQAAANLTSRALLGYSPAMLVYALDQLLVFAFYSRQKALAPALVGAAGTAIYLAVAFPLLRAFDVFGLTLAYSIQLVAHAATLLWLLRAEFRGGARRILGVLARVVPAALAMGLVVWALLGLWGSRWTQASFLELTVILGLIGLAGATIYGAGLLGTGVVSRGELRVGLKGLRRRG